MTDESTSVRRATRIYEILLRLYPRGHRRAYGPLMIQLFRDQYRDARQQANRGRLLAFWLGTLVDVARSGVREQLTEQTSRMKNTSPEKLTTSVLQDELAKESGVMSERERKVAHILFAILAALYVLVGVGFLLNVLQPEPMTVQQKWLGASASFLIPVLCWSWNYFCRFLPALPRKPLRVAAWVLSSILGTLATVGLMRFIPAGAVDGRCPYPGTAAWAFFPMVIGVTLIFGLEKAAWRKVATTESIGPMAA